jgi:hypothetical protein
MNILTALRREEKKFRKQAEKIQRQLETPLLR